MEPVTKCASLIAYLEGWHKLPLPSDAHNPSVANIQKRIVALERAVGIASPPPPDASSWNGLVWRTWQVRFKGAAFYRHPVAENVEDHAAMVEDDCTLASLWRAVDGLDPGLPALQCPSCEGSEADAGSQQEACLGAMIQKLTYIAGSLARPFPDHDWTRALIYAYAAGVAFSMASRLEFARRHNLPGQRPPQRWQASDIPPGVSVVRAHGGKEKTRKASRKPSPAGFGRFFRGRRPRWSAWMSKLRFWRSKKNEVYSDSSSGSSREIVD